MSQNALGLCNFSFLCLLIVDDDTKMLLLATSTGTQVPRHDLRLKKSFFELVFSKISNSSAVQLDSLKWSTPPQKAWQWQPYSPISEDYSAFDINNTAFKKTGGCLWRSKYKIFIRKCKLKFLDYGAGLESILSLSETN